MNKYLLTEEESERLLFRTAAASDFGPWLAFHKDPRTSGHWIMEPMLPEDACRQWFDAQSYRYENDLGGMNALVDKSTGRLIGFCGLLVQTVDQKTELEIGYSILPEYWGQGYATEAAIKCRDYAFEHYNIESIISIISLTNKASETVALKNGMKISAVTSYKGNRVNIFRIDRSEWKMRALIKIE